MENSAKSLILFSEDDIRNNLIICKICQNIIIEPYHCDKCEACFCKECIMFTTASNPKCPTCNAISNFNPSPIMEAFLSLFKYNCINGCNKELTYKELLNHLSECPNVNLPEKYEEIQKEIKNLEEEIKKKDSEIKETFSKLKPYRLTWRGMTYANVPYYISEIHPHPLYRIPQRGGHCSCDVCRRHVGNNESPYTCVHCDFDYCEICVSKEKEKCGECLNLNYNSSENRDRNDDIIMN